MIRTPQTPGLTKPSPRRSRRAIALIELIVVVLLLVGFMTILTSLFVTTYHAQVNAIKRDNLLYRIDSALGTMRRDVWSARRMAYTHGHLDLTISDQQQVRWDTSEPHRLTRRQTAGSPDTQLTQTWIDLPTVDDVNVHGPLVTLTFKEQKQRESLTFVSQLLLGGSR
ncbi:MAG: hypothetical protein ACTHN5_11220 [Phycisphaerae bacterium]